MDKFDLEQRAIPYLEKLLFPTVIMGELKKYVLIDDIVTYVNKDKSPKDKDFIPNEVVNELPKVNFERAMNYIKLSPFNQFQIEYIFSRLDKTLNNFVQKKTEDLISYPKEVNLDFIQIEINKRVQDFIKNYNSIKNEYLTESTQTKSHQKSKFGYLTGFIDDYKNYADDIVLRHYDELSIKEATDAFIRSSSWKEETLYFAKQELIVGIIEDNEPSHPIINFISEKLQKILKVRESINEIHDHAKGFEYEKEFKDVSLSFIRLRDFIPWFEDKILSLTPSEEIATKTNQEPIDKKHFTNNFNEVDESIVYDHFHNKLVGNKLINKHELLKFLRLAFQEKSQPTEKIKFQSTHLTKENITNFFFAFYKELSSSTHGKKSEHVKLLSNHFEGYEYNKVFNNFGKNYIKRKD